jgi:hypothetical protein
VCQARGKVVVKRRPQGAIGTGCAERTWVTTRWEGWLDENGASAGKQVNEAASRLAQSFGWQLSLAGPVVIVGLDQDTDPAALSPGQIDAILEKTRTPSLAGGDDVAGEDPVMTRGRTP